MPLAGLTPDPSERSVDEVIADDRGSLSAIVEATTDLVSIRMLDCSGITYMNQAGRAMLGLGPREQVPDLVAFRSQESLAQWTDLILPSALRHGSWSGETSYVSRSGRVIPVSQQLLVHASPDGKIQLSTIARDISDRRRSAADLRASDEALRFAVEAADMGVWELDVRTRHVNWTEVRAPDSSASARHFSGTEEDCFAAMHVDDRDAVRQAITRAIAERQNLSIVFRTVGPRGTTRWFDCRGRVLYEADMTPGRIVGVSTDVTERRLLEAQLRQSQKMDAIGQLAGGVAHDFNNLLTAILGFARFAGAGLAPDDRRRRDVDEITKAAERAASLTRQLLAFSRSQVLRPTLLDLNQLVTGVSEMLARLIGAQIVLDVVPAPDLALVLADAGQLEQVVVNLSVNARDAMEQGGRLTLQTANVELHAGFGLPGQVVVPGWYVMLAVVDTGVGMDAGTKRGLFEPFFTTKERGKGTGLGLATVYGIVKQSSGYIWVESEPGQGAAFRVYLPRAACQVAPGPPAVETPSPARGAERLLLVEDETSVRHLAGRVLEDAGYRVLYAVSGAHAASIFAEHRGEIDLLVTDVVMPEMTGPELFRHLSDGRPGLKVVYMSGYANDTMSRQLELDPGQRCLQKPFTADQLVSCVRGALDIPPGMVRR